MATLTQQVSIHNTRARPPRRQNVLVERSKFIAALFIFRAALDICYVYYMVPAFSDHNLTPMIIDFNFTRYIFSYFFVFLAGLFCPFDKKNFSGIAFLFFLIFSLIPTTTMVGYNQALSLYAVVLVLVALLTTYLTATMSFSNIKLPIVENGQKVVWTISILFIGSFIVWSVASGAIATISFNLDDIYLFRQQTHDLEGAWIAYTNLWAQKIFNPLLFAIALGRKNILLIALTIAMQFYFFGISHHRVHMFVPILVYAVYILYQKNLSLSQLCVLFSVAILVLLALALRYNWDDIAAIIIRRAFFVSPAVTFEWIDYFHSRPKIYFSDNLLASLSKTEYTGVNIPHLIGDYMLPGKRLAFNTGLIGSGYAQMGFWGVMFYASVLGFVIKFVNLLVYRGLSIYIVAAVLAFPVRTAWVDSDLFTALLSHGILIGIITMWLLGTSPLSKAHK